MVVNIGTKTISPGQTHVFNSVGGVLKRVYFYVVATDVASDTPLGDLQLSFSDTFTDKFTFTVNEPTFKMQSDKGTYQGKIYIRNQGTLTNHSITYIEILQP